MNLIPLHDNIAALIEHDRADVISTYTGHFKTFDGDIAGVVATDTNAA